jgi:hypothetical protein
MPRRAPRTPRAWAARSVNRRRTSRRRETRKGALKHGIPLHDTTTLEIIEAAVAVGMDREEVAACFTAAGMGRSRDAASASSVTPGGGRTG